MRSWFLVLSLSVRAVLAEAQDPVKMTIQEAVEVGLRRNLALQEQRNQLGFTTVNATSSLLQMAPSVSIDAVAGRFDGNSFNQQLGKVVNGKTDFVNGNISASMPVFNGLSRVNTYRQAKNANEAQLEWVQRTEQDIIRNIASQYLNVLLDQQLLRIDRENIETQQKQYSQIKAQVELGARAEADLYNQEFQVRNAELLAVRSENRLRNDMAILAQTLVLDPSVKYELIDPEWDLTSDFADRSLDELNNIAMANRGDLTRADLSAKAAQFGMATARGRYLPQVSAFASLSSRYNYIFDFPDNRSFEEQFRQDNRQVNYGLQLSIPIFDGLQQRARVAQARVTYENAKLGYLRTELQVKTDVLLAYQNYKDAITSQQSSQAQLRSAELAYQMEKERYDLGVSNIVQLTTANQAFVRAQSDYANARYTLMFQRLLINFALGTLKAEDVPSGR
ncbi:MAG: TolC family protein [Cyclobacteriaceae bacterium]|jgi:outer membrane protein|nr:TolC family protein [Cyclobacteriaceae bacterium]